MACTMTSSPTSGDLQIISRIAVFRGLRPETVAHVIAPAPLPSCCRRIETLFRQGDPATAFFIVIDGWIKLYRITISGEETVLNVLTRGGSYAEAHALTGALLPRHGGGSQRLPRRAHPGRPCRCDASARIPTSHWP